MAKKASKPPRPAKQGAADELGLGNAAPPKMPKRGPLAKPAPGAAANGERDEARKPKRGLAQRPEAPNLVIPVIAWIAIALLGYGVVELGKKLLDVDLNRQITMAIGGLTLLLFVGGPIYRNGRQLKRPYARAIVYAGAAIALVCGGLGIFTAAEFGEPVATGEILPGADAGAKAAVALPGTHYRLYLSGQFPDVDKKQKEADEAVARGDKKARAAGGYKLSAAYAVQLRSADGQAVLGNYAGKFEQERVYRRVSKRATGYVTTVRTTIPYDLDVAQPGNFRMQIVTLGDTAEQKIGYAIYRDRQFPLVLSLLGLLTALGVGFVDFLLKPLRAESFFAAAFGAAYGAAAYYAASAMPQASYADFGLCIIVGGTMGAGLAYIACLAVAKLYQKAQKRWQLNLT